MICRAELMVARVQTASRHVPVRSIVKLGYRLSSRWDCMYSNAHSPESPVGSDFSNTKPVTVVIMADGPRRRLRPLSKHTPRPMTRWWQSHVRANHYGSKRRKCWGFCAGCQLFG